MKEITNIFFDLDGTLSDSKEGIINCFKFMLREHGSALPSEDLSWVVGPPFKSSVAKVMKTEDKTKIEAAVKTYREKYIEEGIFQNKLFQGVPEMLEKLALNRKLLIATTKPKPQAETVLKHFGIRHFFHSVYGSNLDGSMSDKRILLTDALEREELQTNETAMVGDRIFDMEGATHNRLYPVGVSYGYGSVGELALAQAVASSPQELSDIFCST